MNCVCYSDVVENALCMVEFILPLEVVTQDTRLFDCSAQTDLVAHSDSFCKLLPQIRMVKRIGDSKLAACKAKVSQELLVGIMGVKLVANFTHVPIEVYWLAVLPYFVDKTLRR